MNDNELIILANENDENAESLLIEKYDKIIKRYVNANINYAKLTSLDEKDLYQEGLLGLTYAIKNFDATKNVTFYTYACLCIETNIKSAIRTFSRYKFKILNESISLDKIFEESDLRLYDVLKDEQSDPSKKIIDKEQNETLLKTLNEKLTDFEKIVLNYKIQGLDNKEISIILEKDKRSIENTITRIRSKYKEIKKINKN